MAWRDVLLASFGIAAAAAAVWMGSEVEVPPLSPAASWIRAYSEHEGGPGHAGGEEAMISRLGGGVFRGVWFIISTEENLCSNSDG